MANKTNKPVEGERFKTNQGDCVVLKYNGAFDVLVQFQDEHGFIKRVRTGDLRKGEVANPFFKSVFGVGCFGAEKSGSVGYKAHTREYMFWNGAMERCYSGKSLLRSPTYEGCTVHEAWHNFQDFAEWCQCQVGFMELGWQLDKDLLGGITAGKVYGPDTCIFVPKEINTLFIVPTTKEDGLPTGVSYDKSRGNYQAGCGGGGYRKALGRFKTPEMAYEAYLKHKKIRVCELIELYRDRLDGRLVSKLEEFLNQ